MSGHICAACRKNIRQGECTGESSLYSPNRSFTLCEPCWLDEDARIEEVGTNDIPTLRMAYEANLDNEAGGKWS